MELRSGLLVIAVSLAAAQLHAQQPLPAPVPRGAASDVVALERTPSERMTVPVTIGGRGPYRFLVDTGSERSAIARELARELDLNAGTTVTVQSMTEARRTPTVIIPTLKVGKRTLSGIHAPAYARHHLGAEGLLGVDTLRSQRVEFDFARLEMKVGPSKAANVSWPSDTIVVTARNRFGHLMLVDAAFEGERVWVIIDTGAEVTVGNSALRQRLERRGRLGPIQRIGLTSVTGNTIAADYTVARRLRIADAEIGNLPVAFADVVPFRKLRLTKHPAILLGMDALRMFERISLDFTTRKVRMLVPAHARHPGPLAVAGR
jgi:predicted aspartyl protease